MNLISSPGLGKTTLLEATVRALSGRLRLGALGYVVATGSWQCARELLARDIPLVISEAHGPGGLPGSPLPETDGHLLVLRGLRGNRALVNDPAALSAEDVPMEYCGCAMNTTLNRSDVQQL
jgi:hypothetical protein